MSMVLGSCSDEWLNDIEPQGKLLEVNFYSTEDEITSSLVAVYNTFKNQYWQGVWSSYYIFSSLGSDDAVAHGGGRSDRPEFWDIQDYLVSPLNTALEPLWNRSYYGIYRANVIIDRVDVTENDNFPGMVAEAKMLRAYFYFDLVRFFGEVPLIDHVLTADEYFQEKKSVEDIYTLIVQDLKEAIPDLPTTRTGGDRYRMTKYAAMGLLGKVYVYMASPLTDMGNEYYDLAATQLKKVIDEGPYDLEENYNDIWWYNNEFNKETLIEISYGLSDLSERWDNGADATGNVIQQLCGPRGFNGGNDTLKAGWGFDMVRQDLVDQYRAQGDSVRLHGTALAEWQMAEWGYTITERNEDYSGYFTNKRVTWSALNPTGGTWAWGNNERVLRLGDIYLLLAEALNQGSGSDADARGYVNTIRARAGLTTTIEDIESSMGLSLYEAIKLERRLELAQEGNRYFDVIRWGDAGKYLVPLGFTVNKNEFFPIPQSEIDGSGGKLIQNDNY
jgi:hypothetical protein